MRRCVVDSLPADALCSPYVARAPQEKAGVGREHAGFKANTLLLTLLEVDQSGRGADEVGTISLNLAEFASAGPGAEHERTLMISLKPGVSGGACPQHVRKAACQHSQHAQLLSARAASPQGPPARRCCSWRWRAAWRAHLWLQHITTEDHMCGFVQPAAHGIGSAVTISHQAARLRRTRRVAAPAVQSTCCAPFRLRRRTPSAAHRARPLASRCLTYKASRRSAASLSKLGPIRANRCNTQ